MINRLPDMFRLVKACSKAPSILHKMDIKQAPGGIEMEQKSGVKGRRKERIRNLLEDNKDTVAVPPLLLCRRRQQALRNGERVLK